MNDEAFGEKSFEGFLFAQREVIMMPTWPKHPCRYPGCAKLTANRYCEEHTKLASQQYEKYGRDPAARRRYGSAWRKLRAQFLSGHPLCEECRRDGRLTPATVVDHIIPHKGNRDLFWDEKNWQALCKPCHDRKTAKEDGGFGNIIS